MSLTGIWQLACTDSSSQWPAVEFPASLRLGASEILEVTHSVSPGFEEIKLYQQNGRYSNTTYIERGKLNYLRRNVVSCVISSDTQFTELSILHMGPKQAHRVHEKYKMTSNSMKLILDIIIEIPESKGDTASVCSFTKHYIRTNFFDNDRNVVDNFKLVFPREIVDETSCRPDAAAARAASPRAA